MMNPEQLTIKDILKGIKLPQLWAIIVIIAGIIGGTFELGRRISVELIPKDAAELSLENGQRIVDLEEMHIQMIGRYFESYRDRVDRFVYEEWVPLYSVEFFTNKTIEDAWNHIVTSGEKAERDKFISILGPKLQSKISEKQFEMTRPINIIETKIKNEIRNHYYTLKANNNSITSYLVSASKLTENRNRFLANLSGVTDSSISSTIDKLELAIGKLSSTPNTKDQYTEEYGKRLEAIISSLENDSDK